MATKNQEVAELLENIADLLEVKGEEAFKVIAYRNAARRIDGMQEDIERLFLDNRLKQIPGVGDALAKKIAEFLTTGKLEFYERLKAEFPPGLVILLEVPGLGPRKARIIYDHLGLSNLEQLEQALRDQKIRHLPGMGEKTEENLQRELQRLKVRSERHLLGAALPLAEEMVARLAARKPVQKVAYAGSLRRMCDTIGDVDLLVAATDHQAVVDLFLNLPMVVDVLAGGPERCSVLVRGGKQVDLRVVDPKSWGAALQYFTGSKAHNIRLRELAVGRGWKLNEYGLFDEATGKRLDDGEEASIYERLGLPWIPPELREDEGEMQAAQAGRLPKLLELEDLQGDLHTHTNWTDGAHSLEEMVTSARDAGLAYIAITDHTKSLGVTRGLNEERVLEQRRLVNRMNQELAPFRVLLGTEMDIRVDGTLDFEDDLLEQLDYVSVSIHSAMSQGEAQMTERVLRAIGNPQVITLNHPSGRMLRRRDRGYEIDLERVIAGAARHGVAVEINSQPHRLDLDARWARRAREAGVKLAINTDAHARTQFGLLRYGVGVARRAWAERGDVLNALSADDLQAAIEQKREGSIPARP